MRASGIVADHGDEAQFLPEFIGIGAQRCATSWLFQCLKRHPEIFMPRKECQFFNHEFEKGVRWYVDQYFRHRPEGCRVAGEFSPDYLSDSAAITRMAATVPNAKLIVSLREPVARAYSAYKLYQSHGKYMDMPFTEAAESDSTLVNNGLYGAHLKHVFTLYPRDQVRVYLHEDIESDPQAVLSDLYGWLGVDPGFCPDSVDKVYNISALSSIQSLMGLPALQRRLQASFGDRALSWVKHSRLGTLARRYVARRHRRAPAMHADCNTLKQRFHSDILHLQELLGRDLSHWL